MREYYHGTFVGVDPGGHHYFGPHEDLAIAIVKQAVKDYVKTIKLLWLGNWKSDKQKRAALRDKAELEGFFHSGWYEFLTDIAPEILIREGKRIGKEKAEEAIRRANRRKAKKLADAMPRTAEQC